MQTTTFNLQGGGESKMNEELMRVQLTVDLELFKLYNGVIDEFITSIDANNGTHKAPSIKEVMTLRKMLPKHYKNTLVK